MRITESRLRRIIRSVITEAIKIHGSTRVPPGFEGIVDVIGNREDGGFTIIYTARDEIEHNLARLSLEGDLSSVYKTHDVDQYIEENSGPDYFELRAKYPDAKTPDGSVTRRLMNIGLDMDLFNRR